ncbi:glycine-rich RNA-binding protein GRP1A [Prunus yedoensis var. nudiflora]|uniref:Glycine-rich RNA-binding protein GRP1A n=1 Tax=Prunus yedoensis var. nudiflora TaxID=2094558 RepID=A0A314ZK95_PRUYE|nr:glycine-rich RNA-binding protein GRP1A [Prunus yedoensis var. nudiflora]
MSEIQTVKGKKGKKITALGFDEKTQFLFNLIILSFVGGLAWTTDNDALERAFSPFGEIIELKGRLTQIINDRETGRSMGFSFGFVTFSNEKAMRDAIEGMNNQYLTVVTSPSTRPSLVEAAVVVTELLFSLILEGACTQVCEAGSLVSCLIFGEQPWYHCKGGTKELMEALAAGAYLVANKVIVTTKHNDHEKM